MIKYLKKTLKNTLIGNILKKVIAYNPVFSYIPIPRLMIIDISNNCNATCPFCPRSLMEKPPNGIMSIDIFNKIIKQLVKIRTIKAVRLYATGEPLLNPNFDIIVDILKKLNYHISVSTNLGLAHKHLESLAKVDYLQYSIEGWDKESYEFMRKGLIFEKVFDNIQLLNTIIQNKPKDQRPIRNISLMLTKKTKIKEFFETWEEYTDYISFGVMSPEAIWNTESGKFDLLQNESLEDYYFDFAFVKRRNYCTYPFKIITVNAKGDLTLCCSDFMHNFNLGNIEKISYSFFLNKTLNRVRQEFIFNKIKICNQCQHFYAVNKEQVYTYFPELHDYSKRKNVLSSL